MIAFAVSFIAGIAAFNFLPFFPFSIIIFSILASVALFFGKSQNKKKAFIIILIFAFGFLYSFIRQETPPGIGDISYGIKSSEFSGENIYIEGTIADVPELSGDNMRFTLDNIELEKQKINGKVRLFVMLERFFANNQVKHFMFSPGDRIRAVAKLSEPGILHNPGVYQHDLKKEGIILTGFVKQMSLINRDGGFMTWINNKRQMMGRIIDNSLYENNASFHKAIIPGLKRGITQDMRDAFSSTGLAHLLSISGTHFGVLAFIVFKFIKGVVKLFPVRVLSRMTLYLTPTQTAVILTLPVLLLYALISGASIPTIRAMIMVFIYMTALFIGRKDQWLNSLSIAALIILLWRPGALFDLSFQLSFTAVLSIGYVLEKRSALKNIRALNAGYLEEFPREKNSIPVKALEKISTAMLITVAAVLGTAPFVILYFKQFPLISPLTNLLITPFICMIILPLGFFTSFSALLFNMPSIPLKGLTNTVTHFSLSFIKTFSGLPYANLRLHDPSFIIIMLYFLSLIFIIKGRSKLRFLPFIFVICIYVFNPHLSIDSKFSVTFLDVGQGESSILELPDKKIMLVDGGKDRTDMGRRVVAPYLWSKGIKRIDFMVLSHPHPDHFGGLMYIMDNFKVKEILLNGRTGTEAGDFFRKLKERKIPVRVLKRGDLLETEDYRIYVLHPYDEFHVNENNDSLVLKIDSGSMSVLFTGDIDEKAEENLIHLGGWLKSDILKVPHHGGRTSSSREFIEAVSPETAIVSVGKNNIYNHPHKETIERYRDTGVNVFRTDRDGAVTITSKNNSYEVKTYWDSRFKKVQSLKDEFRNLRLLL